MTAPRQRLIYLFTTVFALLLVPFIAMQFSDQVNWTFGDFLLAGILLSAAGLTFEFLSQKAKGKRFRLLLALLILAGLLLIWAELAVGLIESILTSNH